MAAGGVQILAGATKTEEEKYKKERPEVPPWQSLQQCAGQLQKTRKQLASKLDKVAELTLKQKQLAAELEQHKVELAGLQAEEIKLSKECEAYQKASAAEEEDPDAYMDLGSGGADAMAYKVVELLKIPASVRQSPLWAKIIISLQPALQQVLGLKQAVPPPTTPPTVAPEAQVSDPGRGSTHNSTRSRRGST